MANSHTLGYYNQDLYLTAILLRSSAAAPGKDASTLGWMLINMIDQILKWKTNYQIDLLITKLIDQLLDWYTNYLLITIYVTEVPSFFVSFCHSFFFLE